MGTTKKKKKKEGTQIFKKSCVGIHLSIYDIAEQEIGFMCRWDFAIYL